MKWLDDNNNILTLGDEVIISNIVHKIKLINIKDKFKMLFVPISDENVLIEYHFLNYKEAKHKGLIKIL